MPNIKSAKKRVITSAKKAENNRPISVSSKTAIKKVDYAVKNGQKEDAKEKLNIAIKRIDKATSSGLMHKNKAAREKSRLTKKVNSME